MLGDRRVVGVEVREQSDARAAAGTSGEHKGPAPIHGICSSERYYWWTGVAAPQANDISKRKFLGPAGNGPRFSKRSVTIERFRFVIFAAKLLQHLLRTHWRSPLLFPCFSFVAAVGNTPIPRSPEVPSLRESRIFFYAFRNKIFWFRSSFCTRPTARFCSDYSSGALGTNATSEFQGVPSLGSFLLRSGVCQLDLSPATDSVRRRRRATAVCVKGCSC